jgi:hypothetical protein
MLYHLLQWINENFDPAGFGIFHSEQQQQQLPHY